jgi:group II intron reverse transcriptase/maturase
MNKNRIEGGAEQGERANQGAAGIDGLSIDETAERLRAEWPAIREQLPRGTYRPEPGRRVVVDVDLEKFFDRVNHNIPIDRLRKRVAGAGVIRLVRAYLTGGIMDGGVLMARSEGTPQGGPLSPLLANVLLDEVDKELEQRSHSFVRYADDANVYVRGRRAGKRVMALLLRLDGRLRLKVNEAKSAVASVFRRKFLGYSFRVAAGGKIERRAADKAMTAFKARVRKLSWRSGGASLQQVVERLRSYVLSWKAYLGKAETPKVWREAMRKSLRKVLRKEGCRVR